MKEILGFPWISFVIVAGVFLFLTWISGGRKNKKNGKPPDGI